MNQIAIETTAAEQQATEVQTLADKQMEEAMAELNLSQLALVGGGSGAFIW